jgi:hypothetical protein
LSTNIVLVGDRKHVIASGGKLFQCEYQILPLLFGWLQFATYCFYGVHEFNIPLTVTTFTKKTR